MSKEEKSKISRRKYLKYVGGAVAAAAIGAAGYEAYQTMQPPPGPPMTTATTATVPATTTFTAPMTTSHEPVTLNIMAISGARFETPMRALVPSFQAKYPWITVNINALGLGDVLSTKGPLELSSRKGAFDILTIDAIFTTVYAEAGWTADITDWILSKDPEVGVLDFETDLPENVRFWTMQDVFPTSEKYKRYFAVTSDCNCFVHFFRKDIFDSMGLGYGDIQKYPDVLDVEKKLFAKGYKSLHSNEAPIWSSANFQSLLWSAGGQMWDEQTFKPLLNTPEAKSALQFMKAESAYDVSGCLTWADPELDESFMRGQGVYAPHEWANPPLTDPKFNQYAAVTDVTQLTPEWPDATGQAPRVVMKGRAPTMGGLPYCIDSASKHPYEAYLFLRWLVLKENAKTYVDNTGQPGRHSILNDPAIQKEHPYFAGLAANLPISVYRGGVPEYFDVDTVVGRDVNSYLAGEISLDACMSDMQSKVEAIFKKSGRFTGTSYAGDGTLNIQKLTKYIVNRAQRQQSLRLAGLVNPASAPWAVF